MLYQLDAQADYVTLPGLAVPERGSRRASYRIVAMFPIGAEVAAGQLLKSELGAEGAAPVNGTEVVPAGALA